MDLLSIGVYGSIPPSGGGVKGERTGFPCGAAAYSDPLETHVGPSSRLNPTALRSRRLNGALIHIQILSASVSERKLSNDSGTPACVCVCVLILC